MRTYPMKIRTFQLSVCFFLSLLHGAEDSGLQISANTLLLRGQSHGASSSQEAKPSPAYYIWSDTGQGACSAVKAASTGIS